MRLQKPICKYEWFETSTVKSVLFMFTPGADFHILIWGGGKIFGGGVLFHQN